MSDLELGGQDQAFILVPWLRTMLLQKALELRSCKVQRKTSLEVSNGQFPLRLWASGELLFLGRPAVCSTNIPQSQDCVKAQLPRSWVPIGFDQNLLGSFATRAVSYVGVQVGLALLASGAFLILSAPSHSLG